MRIVCGVVGILDGLAVGDRAGSVSLFGSGMLHRGRRADWAIIDVFSFFLGGGLWVRWVGM